MKSLASYNINERGVFTQFLDFDTAIILADRGILEGVHFTIIAKIPFNGPIVIDANQQRISLRRVDAEKIFAE